ncbi:MAG: hotdog fold domain-containing protein [Gammaproteobacteria bacterium]
MAKSIGPNLRQEWRRFSRLPGSKWLFSHALGSVVPYSGTLGARVELLEPGHCVVTLRDRRRVRNHLNSVHAMALANLAELATGLALMNSLPDGARGILAGFSIDYLKKARGQLTATCHCDIPPGIDEHEYTLTGEIRNTDGEVVALARARWLVGPEKHA